MRAFIAGLLLFPAVGLPGEIIESSVSVDDGVFTISVDAHINASPQAVYRHITDYSNLPLLNPSIRESRVTHTFSPARHRVRTVMRACILFFCRSILQVQDITQHGGDRVSARMVPGLSDFRQGQADWLLTASGEFTTMHFSAELEPDFWVPPVIGPWLFKRKVIRELLISAAYMESM